MFWEKSLMLNKAAFIWSKNYIKTLILLQFKVTVFYFNILWNVIYFCDGKAEFSALLLQSSVSHDEIIVMCRFGAQETLLSMLKTVMLLNILQKPLNILVDTLPLKSLG